MEFDNDFKFVVYSDLFLSGTKCQQDGDMIEVSPYWLTAQAVQCSRMVKKCVGRYHIESPS